MDDDDNEIEEVQCQISLSDFPGSSETFEIAAKFCYVVKIDLSSSNIVPLRCAGEYLDMTEEYSEDNLISKTERFLSQSVLKSFKESLRALKSCERVKPLVENLGITQRCIDFVASHATSTDPSLFGWPISNGGPNRNANADAVSASSASKQLILWNGIDAASGRRMSKHADSWFEDLVVLSLLLFKRLIFAMKSGDLSLEMQQDKLLAETAVALFHDLCKSSSPSSSTLGTRIRSGASTGSIKSTATANGDFPRGAGKTTIILERLLGEWNKGPHLTGYVDFTESIKDHHSQFNRSFPWASWSNCPPTTLPNCRTKLESCLESMAHKGIQLGSISSHQIFFTLSKWHGLNTDVRHVITSNGAAKNAVSEKVSKSVLWDQAVFALSARYNAQEIDGILGLTEKKKNVPLEEASYYREAVVASRLTRKNEPTTKHTEAHIACAPPAVVALVKHGNMNEMDSYILNSAKKIK
ncbi:hypothetical protein TB1_029460 [Malus domestica]